MLIYDPNEPSSNFSGRVNDGGQRDITLGSILTLDKLYSTPYLKVGEVLGHEYGLSSQEPDYTYLKGDISNAYSGKVAAYERSFMFLNLKNGRVFI